MSLPKCGALAFVFMVAGAAALAGTTFHCSLKPISGSAWIPSRITLHFTDNFRTAQVTDLTFGVAVPAKVVQHSKTSYALSWALTGLAVYSEPGIARPRFRAVLNTANQKMSLQAAKKGGNAKLPRGRGFCETENSLSLLAQNEGDLPQPAEW
ncbi:hypothetical protein KUW17_03945 [Leisingera aquaemixtae]|nr:hypothetical protein [Leisingera aquaemixtae]